MTEKTPATLDRLWDDIPTGPAPIGDLITAGHALNRRKRNTRVLGAAAATALILGVGTAGVQSLRDGDDVPRDLIADGPVATNERNFTVPGGSSEERRDLVLNGDVQVSGDTEPAFDAMTNRVDAAYPGWLTSGGAPAAAPDQDGMRWLIATDKPTSAQLDLLSTYPGPLHIYYGNAPSSESMRKFAHDLRQEFIRQDSPIEFQGYGFNDDHTGLEVLYSAPPTMNTPDIQAQALDLVAQTNEQRESEPEFAIDFIEVSGPALAESGPTPNDWHTIEYDQIAFDVPARWTLDSVDPCTGEAIVSPPEVRESCPPQPSALILKSADGSAGKGTSTSQVAFGDFVVRLTGVDPETAQAIMASVRTR